MVMTSSLRGTTVGRQSNLLSRLKIANPSIVNKRTTTKRSLTESINKKRLRDHQEKSHWVISRKQTVNHGAVGNHALQNFPRLPSIMLQAGLIDSRITIERRLEQKDDGDGGKKEVKWYRVKL